MLYDRKLKVLWFSNYRFTNEPIKTTGTWLKVMGESISKFENIELINVTFGNNRSIAIEWVNGIQQYLIPSSGISVYELPDERMVNQIDGIIKDVQADLIHVWGTESIWGLITCKYVDQQKVLLEIQGVLCQVRQQFFGGLLFFEILKCTGPKEILKYSTHLVFQYLKYGRKVKNEAEIILAHRYIAVQSIWTEGVVKSINTVAITFKSLIPLRSEFTNACCTWQGGDSGRIFTSAANLHAFKGVHVALEAVALLRQNGIHASLYIAGTYNSGIRKSGYQRYLERLIHRHKLEEHVHWLGALDAQELVRELKMASAVIIPSFVESYCVSLYEALCIGAPVVCSYAGAMPEITTDTSNIKYFQPGDFRAAAHFLKEILVARTNERPIKQDVIFASEAVKRQLDIYSRVLNT